MPQTFITPDAVQRVHDFNSLLAFFADGLGWDVDPETVLEDVTFDWEAGELNLSETAARRLAGGVVRQLQPLTAQQPWGIFFVEFADAHIYRTALREVLRALVPKQRGAAPDRQTWQQENLLFICATRDYSQFTFAHFRGADERRAVLAAFGWERGDTHLRTLCEHNLPALRWPDAPHDADAWLKQWRAAFDVEAVTDKFFKDYSKIFQAVETEVRRSIADTETARLYTQRLFNRLMFLYFIQKKGWLSYDGDKNYLRALFTAAAKAGENFLRERLYWLFFWGLSNVGESREVHTQENLQAKRGDVPYLNGGLFDMEDEHDSNRDAVRISNEALAAVLELFERYNFTVTESTPLDVQVAVDPEMLGKVFEELVTGRHESGSYYTPRPIVSFMCREALKHYLSGVLSSNFSLSGVLSTNFSLPDVLSSNFSLSSSDTGQTEVCTQNALNAIARFVDYGDAGELNDPEKVLEALQNVKVCDPACGSGAYLLGMLQELLRLRAALFQSRRLDDKTQYERKRAIIENNLYGVDKDRFAVQVACLRLWLSLAIEADTPQPLPNLDFKIGCGDSLTAPAPQETQPDLFRSAEIRKYQAHKNEYLKCNDYRRKGQLKEQIEALRESIAAALKHAAPPPNPQRVALARKEAELLPAAIRRFDREGLKHKAAEAQNKLNKLRKDLAAWENAAAQPQDGGFDWAVEFAEVFLPDSTETPLLDEPPALFADLKAQAPLVAHTQADDIGGFDITLANPPYVQQEDIGVVKIKLQRLYPNVATGKSDLYVYFYERAAQILKPRGIQVFICSNSWLDIGYGGKLQKYILNNGNLQAVFDSTIERQFTTAKINTIISFFVKGRHQKHLTTRFISLQAPFEEAIQDPSKTKVRSVTRKVLLEAGLDETGVYLGDKWGGKYLRAPDIFFKIINECSASLEKLVTLCDVEGYIHDNNTGGGFPLVHYLKSIKGIKKIYLTKQSLGVQLYGVKSSGNSRLIAPLLFPRTFGNRHIVVWNTESVFGKEFYKIIPKDGVSEVSIAAQMNSTLAILQREILGAANLGDGALKFSGDDVGRFLLVPDLRVEDIENPFFKIATRPILDVELEVKQQDRQELDKVMFDRLGLSEEDLEAVYSAVVDLVRKRTTKAKNITKS